MNKTHPHLLSEDRERAPFFGLENVLADRRLLARWRGFALSILTLKGVTVAILFIAAAAYAIYSASLAQDGWRTLSQILVYLLGYVVLPIYGSLNALGVGAGAFHYALDEGHAGEWVIAGYTPERTALEVLSAKAYRHLPSTLVYAGLVVVAIRLAYYMDNSSAPPPPTLTYALFAFAAILYQYLLISASAFIGALAWNIVARYISTIAYALTHSILPFLIVQIIGASMSNGYANSPAMEFWARALSPLGAIMYAIDIASRQPMYVTEINPYGAYADSALIQVLFIYLFARAALWAYRRRVLS